MKIKNGLNSQRRKLFEMILKTIQMQFKSSVIQLFVDYTLIEHENYKKYDEKCYISDT